MKNSGSKKTGDVWNAPLKKKGSKNANDGVKNGLTKNGEKKGFTKKGLKNGRAKKKGEKKKELKKKKRGKVGKMNAFAKKGEGKEPTKTLAPNQGLERREMPPAPEVNRDPMGPAPVLLRAKFDVRLAPEKVLDPGPGLAKLCALNLDHPELAGVLLEFQDRRLPPGGSDVMLPGAGLAKLCLPNVDQVPGCGNC